MTPLPPPDFVFQALTGYQLTAAFDTAVELDLFSTIAAGRVSAPAIAATIGASERGVRSLADYLTAAGFLTKSGSNYALTGVSATYLDRAKPTFLGDLRVFLGSDELRRSFGALTAAVRAGGQVYSESGTTSVENPVWVDFARSMAPMIHPIAQQVADRVSAPGTSIGKVLDIAAGHGLFGLEVARRQPTAQVYGLDWPRVLDVAAQNAQRLGCSNRFHRIEGSAFEVNWGTGYDLVLLPNFLHHFDPDCCIDLLNKARSALVVGGMVAVVEIVPRENRVEPPNPAMFSLVMLATTTHGDAYTTAEYREMFAKAGFPGLEPHELMNGNNALLLSRKK